MILNIKDKRYNNIVKDIIRNPLVKEMQYIRHHGISRLEHSIKISYKSYSIARKLNFDYVSVARAGLLHDFYLDGDDRDRMHIISDTFIHPKKAIKMASDNFKLNDVERNIIEGHMFPVYYKIPKYKESILVNLVDKYIGALEFLCNFKNLLKYKINYSYLIVLLMLSTK